MPSKLSQDHALCTERIYSRNMRSDIRLYVLSNNLIRQMNRNINLFGYLLIVMQLKLIIIIQKSSNNGYRFVNKRTINVAPIDRRFDYKLSQAAIVTCYQIME